MRNNNIFLIGPLGAGKTTIGRQLAKQCHLVFYDSDQEIEKKTGVSVATIFEYEGEAGFRKREIDMIGQLTQLQSIVLSSGGGAVIAPENQKALKENGTVVYLRASIETQLERTNQRKGIRPMIDTEDPLQAIIALNEERMPLYEGLADLTYDTDALSPKTIAEAIFAEMNNH